MSKRIKITEAELEEYLHEIAGDLRNFKSPDGKVSLTKEFPELNRKATVAFNSKAWTKMLALLNQFDKEVAWHGVASRYGDLEDDVYLISDIVVYPQAVTGVNVETDQQAYEEWLFGLPEEIGNSIRMQGHSHVRMGCTPSATDINNEKKMVAMLDSSSFYIFMIWNKSLDHTAKIYDVTKNVFFENKDIDVALIDNDINISDFLTEAKEVVKEKVYAPVQYKTNANDKKQESKAKSDTTKDKSKSVGKIPAVNACEDYDIMEYDEDNDEYFEHLLYHGVSYNGYYR